MYLGCVRENLANQSLVRKSHVKTLSKSTSSTSVLKMHCVRTTLLRSTGHIWVSKKSAILLFFSTEKT